MLRIEALPNDENKTKPKCTPSTHGLLAETNLDNLLHRYDTFDDFLDGDNLNPLHYLLHRYLSDGHLRHLHNFLTHKGRTKKSQVGEKRKFVRKPASKEDLF